VHLSRQTAENVTNSIAASWNLEKNFLASFFGDLVKNAPSPNAWSLYVFAR